MIWVALLRGVNVGGTGKLPMAGFRDLLVALGFDGVRTYIQSGNAVFRSDQRPTDIAPLIRAAIADEFGFAPEVFFRSAGQMSAALDHPFADQPKDKVHAFFLAEAAPVLDLAALERMIAPSERWHLGDGVFYLHHPDGIGRSRLAAQIGKVIGCATTARNLRTIAALVEMTRTDS